MERSPKRQSFGQESSQKRGLFTSLKNPNAEQYLEGSQSHFREQMPNVVPYIQGAFGAGVNSREQTQHLPNSNVYLDPLYNSKGLINFPNSVSYVSYQNRPNRTQDDSRPKTSSYPKHIDSSQNSPRRNLRFNVQDIHHPPAHQIYSKPHIPSYVMDGNVHTVYEGNVKKTFVPQHIYNDIPIYQGQRSHHSVQVAHPPKNEQYSEEAYELMLAHYEKMYKKYLDEKNQNEDNLIKMKNMERIIQDLQNRPTLTNVEYRNGKKTINQQHLAQLIKQRFSVRINDILSRHKRQAVSRVKEAFFRCQLTTTETVECGLFGNR